MQHNPQGLAKVHNDGELGSPGDAVESITYPVSIDGNTMTIDIAFGATGYWHFVLQKSVTTVVDIVVNSEAHNTLETAVLAAGLETTLSGDGPFTLFAPTDDAFAAVDPAALQALLDDPQGALTDVLLYHALDSDVRSTDLMDGMVVPTINGASVTVAINNDGVFINDAQVTMADIVTDNGVVHVIDAVLLPPPVEDAELAGTWKMKPIAQALAVGPALGDFSWWSNSAADVETRACFFDDEYVFNPDGTFQNVLGDETWNEPWQGMDPEGCAAPVAPHDGSAAATWTYDEMAGTVTITGTGAYLGLAKVHNDGELGSPGEAVASITYPMVIEGNTMTIDIAFGATGYWHFVLEKVSTVSVNEIVENLFSFYPNPANNQIHFQSDEQMDKVIIRDITGRVVSLLSNPSQNETIDVSNLAKGLFIIEAHLGNKIAVEKLSIQ